MKKGITVLAASFIVAVGLVLLGVTLGNSIVRIKKMDRVVAVKGLAEKQVDADQVIWSVVYTEVGSSLSEIYTTVESKNKIVKEFLTTNGLSSDEITVGALVVNDLDADLYNPTRRNYRYSVMQAITVSSANVSKVRELITRQKELLQRGIAISTNNYNYPTQFLFTNLNAVKPYLIEEATKNARQTAKKFADDSNSEIGEIKTANQGQISISDRDTNTPHIKVLRVVTTIEYYLED